MTLDILQHLKVPTGDILVVEGKLGKLEMLSLGDYGKDVNIKSDALGLSRIPSPVRHTQLLPLMEKWVITISTQYGCSMGCTFCDVPKVGPGYNATKEDLIQQVITGLSLYPEIRQTKRLNVHYARLGEPTWNAHVLDAAEWMKENLDGSYNVHPVVSTMMPKRNRFLQPFIEDWMYIKNILYKGEAGLQISINSTDEAQRAKMFNGQACTLEEIAKIMKGLVPIGRKITLNFAVADYTVDPLKLFYHFSPKHYICKLTPMHRTQTALSNGIKTIGDYTEYAPYSELEAGLKKMGYDVLVFIASVEEDLGRITCGNAILSGTLPEVKYTEVV